MDLEDLKYNLNNQIDQLIDYLKSLEDRIIKLEENNR